MKPPKKHKESPKTFAEMINTVCQRSYRKDNPWCEWLRKVSDSQFREVFDLSRGDGESQRSYRKTFIKQLRKGDEWDFTLEELLIAYKLHWEDKGRPRLCDAADDFLFGADSILDDLDET
jgi:hypothetical protein